MNDNKELEGRCAKKDERYEVRGRYVPEDADDRSCVGGPAKKSSTTCVDAALVDCTTSSLLMLLFTLGSKAPLS